MRLINCTTLEFEEFYDAQLPEYAILSHRWGDQEVSLKDMRKDRAKAKRGFLKIQKCCRTALEKGLSYAWVDTCCIDKSSSAELSEAINSMYTWYKRSKVCFAYLSDVSDKEHLVDSVWFTRGWTLQELIAPNDVQFYDYSWTPLGSKKHMARELSKITGIPELVITGLQLPQENSVAQRMSWAASRVTTRSEDRAYCLLGLFDINMGLLYGEGERAFQRLQKEIINQSVDRTILLWNTLEADKDQLLASSPADFSHFKKDEVLYEHNVHLQGFDDPILRDQTFSEFSVTNYGIRQSIILVPWSLGVYLALPECRILCSKDDFGSVYYAGFLVSTGMTEGTWTRLNCTDSQKDTVRLYRKTSIIYVKAFPIPRTARKLAILLNGLSSNPVDLHTPYGFETSLYTGRTESTHVLYPFQIYKRRLNQNTLPIRAGFSTLAGAFALSEKQKFDLMMLGFDFFFNPVIVLANFNAFSYLRGFQRMLREARYPRSDMYTGASDIDQESESRLLEIGWARCLDQNFTPIYGVSAPEKMSSHSSDRMKVYQCPHRQGFWEPVVDELKDLRFRFRRVDHQASQGCLGWELNITLRLG